jgi:hypothetical protein
MSWKRRTPAANRRRRHRREVQERFYSSICDSICSALQELNLMYGGDQEALAAATANLLAIAEAEVAGT